MYQKARPWRNILTLLKNPQNGPSNCETSNVCEENQQNLKRSSKY